MCYDINILQFKERDFLEGISKFWRESKPEYYDPMKCWDLRLRKHLGQRYDAKLNVFDWDHSMGLTERGVCISNFFSFLNGFSITCIFSNTFQIQYHFFVLNIFSLHY